MKIELFNNKIISKELEKAVNNGDCCLNKIADELMRINYVEDYDEAEELAEELESKLQAEIDRLANSGEHFLDRFF